MVKVLERYRGTRGGTYYYVVEGSILRHVSRYALGKMERDSDICWNVPVEKVSGKPIIKFDFSRSGYGYVAEYDIEAFIESKYEGVPDYRKQKWSGLLEEGIGRLRQYEFEIFDDRLKELVDEFRSHYIKMINEVKAYSQPLGFELFFAGHAARARDAYHYGVDVALFACLSNPNEESRLMSLQNTCKWVYQLWVLKLACQAVDMKEVKRWSWQSEKDKPYWWIEQGKPTPTCIIGTPHGPITCWFEPQPYEMAHVFHPKRREYVRPDIVMAKGSYNDINKVGSIDLIIECKEKRFQDWEADIESQIPAYLRNFKPKSFVVASLKPVPSSAASELAKKGIDVVCNLTPDNGRAIGQFSELVRRALGH